MRWCINLSLSKKHKYEHPKKQNKKHKNLSFVRAEWRDGTKQGASSPKSPWAVKPLQDKGVLYPRLKERGSQTIQERECVCVCKSSQNTTF